MVLNRVLQIVVIFALVGAVMKPIRAQPSALSLEEIECGQMVVPRRVPPMDYRTDRRMLLTVEHAHFPSHVENLIRPVFTTFGSDIDYTLHAYPNHHRALVTLVRLGEREQTDKPKEMAYTIDCFFRRAIRFVPQDTVVRMLYAQYLIKKLRRDDALRHLDFVQSIAGDNAFTHYNLGLVYLQAAAHDKALEQAHRARVLGMEKAELKDRLTAEGRWREPKPSDERQGKGVLGPSIGASSAHR